MKKIQIKLYSKQTTCEAGKFYDEKQFDHIINQDTDGYYINDEGKKKILFKFRKKVINEKYCDIATSVYKGHKQRHCNRGYASGKLSTGKMRFIENKTSRSRYSTSNISGYYDKVDRSIQSHFKTNLVCRVTSFTLKNKEKFDSSLPFFKRINALYKSLAPKAYKDQIEVISKIPQEMRIDKTAFTTITSNYNWRTACHADKGDYDEGLGNLTVTGDECWEGCYLGFPEFKVAVNLRQGDFLLMNVHQYHCNTQLKKITKNQGLRLSYVCYLRKNMIYCNKTKYVDGVKYYYKG